LRLDYPNYSGALATAGNLVFIGEPDGTFSAHDARTLQELWSFNTGKPAPP
jgi:glucose dehydrogenase